MPPLPPFPTLETLFQQAKPLLGTPLLAIIALGVMGGLLAGLGLAFLLDLTDKRVRYADQITSGRSRPSSHCRHMAVVG